MKLKLKINKKKFDKLLFDNKITMWGLANKTDQTIYNIYRLLNKECTTIKTAKKISKALKQNIDDLFKVV